MPGPNPRGRCLQQRAERLYTTSSSCSRVFALKPSTGDLEGSAADPPKGSSTCSSGEGRSGPAAGQQGAQSGPCRSVSSTSLLSGSSGGRPLAACLAESNQAVLNGGGDVSDPQCPPAATVGCESAAGGQSAQTGRSGLQLAPALQGKVAQRRPAPLQLHGLLAPRDHLFSLATAQQPSQPQPHARQQPGQHSSGSGHARRYASRPPLHRPSRLSMGPPAPVSRGYAAQARATGLALARAGAAAPAASRRRDPFLAVLFARRRRRLLRFLTAGARHDPPSVTPRLSGRTLLSLPEDVMLVIICCLQHKEIGSLFGVCRELRATMRTAMLTHFNLQTPHHGDVRLRTPAPPRAKRMMLVQPSCRAAVGSASTADSMAIPLPRRPSAPRALSFQDVSEGSGDGRWQPHPIMPLSPASVAS